VHSGAARDKGTFILRIISIPYLHIDITFRIDAVVSFARSKQFTNASQEKVAEQYVLLPECLSNLLEKRVSRIRNLRHESREDLIDISPRANQDYMYMESCGVFCAHQNSRIEIHNRNDNPYEDSDDDQDGEDFLDGIEYCMPIILQVEELCRVKYRYRRITVTIFGTVYSTISAPLPPTPPSSPN